MRTSIKHHYQGSGKFAISTVESTIFGKEITPVASVACSPVGDSGFVETARADAATVGGEKQRNNHRYAVI